MLNGVLFVSEPQWRLTPYWRILILLMVANSFGAIGLRVPRLDYHVLVSFYRAFLLEKTSCERRPRLTYIPRKMVILFHNEVEYVLLFLLVVGL